MQIAATPSPASEPAQQGSALPPVVRATDVAEKTSDDAGASSRVVLSAQGQQLAASLTLPDLDGIAKINQALAGLPDTNPAQAREEAQQAREKEKHKKNFSMLAVDGFQTLREKWRAAQAQRPELPVAAQQEKKEKYEETIKDGQAPTGV